jgi:hypothetical protein
MRNFTYVQNECEQIQNVAVIRTRGTSDKRRNECVFFFKNVMGETTLEIPP